MTTEQHQIVLISTLVDTINNEFKLNEQEGEYFLKTECARHSIESIIKTINRTLDPYFVIITDCEVTQNYTSYKIKVTKINQLPLPFYLTSEAGFYSIMVPSLSDWEIVGIRDSLTAVEISEMPMFTVLKLIKEGNVRLSTEEVFKERYKSASDRMLKKVTSIPV